MFFKKGVLQVNIHITDEAVDWYIEEMELKHGSFIRFFVRYGGLSTVQKGFSLGISTESPNEIGAQANRKGITFYIEEKDLWYFDNHDPMIELDTKLGEPKLSFNK